MRDPDIRGWGGVILKLVPLILFLLLWDLAVRHIERGAFFYGSPALVWKALSAQASSGVLWKNLGYTLWAVSAGFLLGNSIGIVSGCLLAYSRTVSAIALPYLVMLGSVPVLAFAPMIVIWFGIGIASKIAMVAFSTAIVAATQTFEGARQADANAIRLLESLGASRLMVFRKVILPSSLVWLFAGLKLNVGIAIMAVFIGEFISAEAGLGYQIVIDMGLFRTSSVLAGVVVISLLSLVLNSIVGLLQRRLMPWARAGVAP